MTSTCPDSARLALGVLRHQLQDVWASSVEVLLDASCSSADWASSGAMSLTGRADGPPRMSPGAPASWMRAAGAILDIPGLDAAALLGERAALEGLHRRAPWSAGGQFRVLRSRDGWFGISLARESDLDLIPALVGGTCTGDPWETVMTWLRDQPGLLAEERCALLGLPAGVVACESHPTRPAVVTTRGGLAVGRRPLPVVLDLSSLWAGPLCGQLLGLRGARVIKVESIGRPDGARWGSSEFFDLLHGDGQESVALDFSNSSDLDFLRRLIRWSDVVIEASRPRALRHLGIHAQEEVARGGIWLSISAYGRASEDRVGFGDDVAAAAGLILVDGSPIPIADAIADPLSGLTAAAAVKCALESTHGWLLDVSMHAVSAHVAGLPGCGEGGEGGEVLDDEASSARCNGCSTRVLPPRHRAITTAACEIGKHTRALREELSRAPI